MRTTGMRTGSAGARDRADLQRLHARNAAGAALALRRAGVLQFEAKRLRAQALLLRHERRLIRQDVLVRRSPRAQVPACPEPPRRPPLRLVRQGSA